MKSTSIQSANSPYYIFSLIYFPPIILEQILITSWLIPCNNFLLRPLISSLSLFFFSTYTKWISLKCKFERRSKDLLSNSIIVNEHNHSFLTRPLTTSAIFSTLLFAIAPNPGVRLLYHSWPLQSHENLYTWNDVPVSICENSTIMLRKHPNLQSPFFPFLLLWPLTGSVLSLSDFSKLQSCVMFIILKPITFNFVIFKTYYLNFESYYLWCLPAKEAKNSSKKW